MYALGECAGSTASYGRCSWLRQAWLVMKAALKARDAQRLQAAILICVQHLAAIDGNTAEAEEACSCFGSALSLVLPCQALFRALWGLSSQACCHCKADKERRSKRCKVSHWALPWQLMRCDSAACIPGSIASTALHLCTVPQMGCTSTYKGTCTSSVDRKLFRRCAYLESC